MPEQTVLRFCISLKDIFCYAITFIGINTCGQGAVGQIAAVYQPIF